MSCYKSSTPQFRGSALKYLTTGCQFPVLFEYTQAGRAVCDRSLDLWGGAVRQHTVNGRGYHSRLGTRVLERPSGAKETWSGFTAVPAIWRSRMRTSSCIIDEREASEPLAQDAFLRSKITRRSAAERWRLEMRFKSWTYFNLIQRLKKRRTKLKKKRRQCLQSVYIKKIKTAQNDARRRPLWTAPYNITTVEL